VAIDCFTAIKAFLNASGSSAETKIRSKLLDFENILWTDNRNEQGCEADEIGEAARGTHISFYSGQQQFPPANISHPTL
jgi:hypothetical protein